MKDALDRAEWVAKTNSTVLLHGESGTGKELIAQTIHNASLRRDKLFIPVNCATLPSELLESEMFGHEKGAFTSATGRKEGRFKLANGSEIFLDEIGDMSTGLQAKLLQVLQDRAFDRVGGAKRIACNVRVIAATNQDLEAKVRLSMFREDLYYCLNVVAIRLAPLWERVEDIEGFPQYFLTKYCMETKRKVLGFTSRTMGILKTYLWPGNVRELENAIEHTVVLGQTDEILPDDLPMSLHDEPKAKRSNYKDSLGETQRQFKKEYIERILDRTKGNRSRAAGILEVQRTYFSRLIKELEIQIGPSATM